MIRPLITTAAVFLAFGAHRAQAQPSEAASEAASIDITFLLLCSVLVFLMQAGFCFLEMGLSRSKNAINIVMKNVTDMSAGTLGFFLIGFSLMFGWSQGGVVGLGNFGFSSLYSGDATVWIFFLFQTMFAATTVTICSGAMAERTYFPGYIVFAVVACGLLYPILGHWCWGGGSEVYGFGGGSGWLATLGFTDFAGSTVVHAVGGAFSLAGIMVLGPRRGRFLKDGGARIFSGHSIPFGALGLFILFFGWFGFNCGSGLNPSMETGKIAVVTLLAGCSGLVSGLFSHWLVKGWSNAESAINGCLGGLVACTACCNLIEPWAALLIGLVAGLITTFGGSILLKAKLDDAVGAVPVHLFCGIWGTLCVSLFNSGQYFDNISIQALGAFVVPAAAFGAAWVVLMIIDRTIGLRASDEAQENGLDFAEHSATAYPDFVVNEE